ncbi:MAG: ABC transporter substrate-binding protein [Burkholderiaceae bacterium]|jgi:branched-chain amino acid transport system substrate-binding protein
MNRRSAFIATLLLALSPWGLARADITIGVSLPLTGPAAGLGIPVKNGLALWPATIAGEKVNLIVLDDATDPTQGVKNARRFTTEDKVDVIVGSVATPVGVAMSDIAEEANTVQLVLSPIDLPEGKGGWSFRLAHSATLMGGAIVAHMKAAGVKTVGFIGYTDAYGESWLKDFSQLATPAGIKIVDVERFARADTSVTAQALKLNAAAPDAILVVASGSGAAMPEMAIFERGYKGQIYQTHAAASRDLVRIGGKEVEGALVASGPAVVAEQLPASHPSKKLAMDYVAQYEKAYGPNSRNQFSAHIYDTLLLLQVTVPQALKKGKPGTPEFRAALKDAIEHSGSLPVSQGVLQYTPSDHYGFTPQSAVILKVVNGEFKLEPN